jgi:hypothetical protein
MFLPQIGSSVLFNVFNHFLNIFMMASLFTLAPTKKQDGLSKKKPCPTGNSCSPAIGQAAVSPSVVQVQIAK